VKWDFSPVDRLSAQPAGEGRLYRGPDRDGATLLFIHGAFHGAWSWAHYVALFSDRGFATAAVDLRGHGGLPQDANFSAQGVREMADDAIAAAKLLGDEFVFVAHSFGALVALAAAREIAPRALVLLAPAPPGGLELPPFAPSALVAPPPETRARKWFLQGHAGDLGPYLARLCAESPALLNATGTLSAEPPAIPMLCLSGSLDNSVFHTPEQDEATAKTLGAELQVIARGSHCLMIDDTWQDSARAILGWLHRQRIVP
jgi:pimeloyl-ACP methyl ester carboxylesterase